LQIIYDGDGAAEMHTELQILFGQKSNRLCPNLDLISDFLHNGQRKDDVIHYIAVWSPHKEVDLQRLKKTKHHM